MGSATSSQRWEQSRRRRSLFRLARESKPSRLDGLTTQSTVLIQIPDDIILSNIIPRLPSKSLMILRCVNKSLNSLVINHYALRPSKIVFVSCESSHKEGKIIPFFHFMERENRIKKLPLETLELDFYYNVRIAGSCDGLLLLVVYTTFHLWNPVTGFFNHVLEFDNLSVGQHSLTNSGICYDSCTDDYKAVVGYDDGCTRHFVFVSGLKNKGWKIVNFQYRCHWATPGVLFNGFLHWGANYGDCESLLNFPNNRIIAFDPKTDEVCELPLPTHCKSAEGIKLITGLGILKDRLCMTFWEDEVIKVVVMKEYGVQESWTPLFEISNLPSQGSCRLGSRLDSLNSNFRLDPLMHMHNGHILIAMAKWDVPIFTYNPQMMEYNVDCYLQMYGERFLRPGYHDPHFYRESLNSPTGLEWKKKQHRGLSVGYEEKRNKFNQLQCRIL